MVSPYYQGPRLTVYVADCRTLDLASLGADLILTDPPRGLLCPDLGYIPTTVDITHLCQTRLPLILAALPAPDWRRLLSCWPSATHVLDPYAGLGGAIKAALDEGLMATAIEIDPVIAEVLVRACAAP